jgi:hypothetical protein
VEQSNERFSAFEIGTEVGSHHTRIYIWISSFSLIPLRSGDLLECVGNHISSQRREHYSTLLIIYIDNNTVIVVSLHREQEGVCSFFAIAELWQLPDR